MRSTFRKKAFTLIELLVVIAIIAILAAILFPVFAQAREAARKSSCLSNTKQVGMAQYQYLQDYDEQFPVWRYFLDAGQTQKVTWIEELQPYAKNRNIWGCPSDPLYSPKNPATTNSYWLNAYISRWSGYTGAQSVRLPEMQYPATTIVFCDGPANDGQHTWPGPPSEWCGTAPDCVAAENRHMGGINYLLADCHAKWYKKDQLKSTTTPDDSATDGVPGLLGLGNKKRSNDGTNPWWRL